MPRLILIAAQSLDGFITRHDQPGTDFCSEADARYFKAALKDFDSLVMGRKTFDTTRDFILNSPSTRYLRKILTSRPEDFRDIAQPGKVEFTNDSPAAIVAELERRGCHRCALLGGGDTYTRFLQTGLVHELWLTLEPRLFGSGTRLTTDTLDLSFIHHSTEQLGPDTLLLKYHAKRPPAQRD